MVEIREDQAIQAWLRDAAERSRRVTSVCGGAFLLGKAGLLAGRRATTHWAFADELAQLCPDVTVDPNPIFVRDGKFTTSAGVSSGIDMALALVEEDHGGQLALEVARYLVLFFKRPGGQAQFSSVLDAQLADAEPIRDVQEWILNNPGTDLSVPALAQRAAMSPRNFARVFQREVGHTPGRYVEGVRITAARKALESTELTIREVARRCGFGTAETFLRAFDRNVGVTPAEYRSRFHAAAPALAEPMPAGAAR
jgi:transcriptional regulator GlxA family with amidase domain